MPASPAPRDTDIDWRLIGEREPFWGVLSNEAFRRENLTAENLARFYESGRADVAQIVERSEKVLGPWRAPVRALDFGCGVGRLTQAMAPLAQETIGYDVSPGMLAQAKLCSQGQASFTSDWPHGGFDWINSAMVFQHIPPAQGFGLLRRLLGQLQPGGLASLHFTVHHAEAPEPDTAPLTRWARAVLGRRHVPAAGEISMYDYDFSRILQAFVEAGVESFAAFHVRHGEHHGVQMIGRRG